MKLIVGLGNPGIIYAGSRHNIGFSVVKRLAKIYRVPLKKDKSVAALAGKAKIKEHSVILATPLTFMNLSGNALRALVKEHKIDKGNLLAVCDDLDLKLGKIRIRASGSSGGHRGLRSIIDSLGNQDFCRLRIGVGRPGAIDTARYVLAHFTRQEKSELKSIIDKACDCCESWVVKGITETMNIFNKRSRDE